MYYGSRERKSRERKSGGRIVIERVGEKEEKEDFLRCSFCIYGNECFCCRI